jgi:hypothetical protein
MMNFRKLKASEIDVRVQSIMSSGAILLLYKDARADMNILDETVTNMLWKREHTRDNQNCIVSIYNKEIGQWISKEDTGTESNTEKEKGLASDSFKRACTNWGIGRELYTSPFIFVKKELLNIINKNGKDTTNDKFAVSFINYSEDGNISELEIINQNKKIVFSNKVKKETVFKVNQIQIDSIVDLIEKTSSDLKSFLQYFKVKEIPEMTAGQAVEGIKMLEKKIKTEVK